MIPDVSLVTTTDKDTYKIRQTVNIASKIINLTSSAIYQNLTVLTSVKDPAGAQIYSSSSTVSTVSPGQSTVHTLVWDTAGLQTEGIYTISQTIKSGEQILNDSSTKVNLLTVADFAIAADSVYRKINRGENATYLIYLTPVDGWNAAVAIGVDELPVGTLVIFAPGNIVPPGESFVMTITTAATTLGIHTLNLKVGQRWFRDGRTHITAYARCVRI
ncbi:hypothetical protein [Desulfobacterium sp. N47]|uniref:Uncharacterized protein n=1 Tax=uncultured Desulfobacterium sp. TaxID=201089 RepID=E1YAP6_9BACT|nr:unknown protein [uncultured Desulfobacterium sp.]